jgi:hypothetical protein
MLDKVTRAPSAIPLAVLVSMAVSSAACSRQLSAPEAGRVIAAYPGWQWEFVETSGGAWLSPERAIAELYDQQRMKRAIAWADERTSQYEATIAAMDGYAENMPRRTDWDFTVAEWDLLRKTSAKAYRTFSPSPERTKIAESLEKPAIDAWGNEVLLHFESKTRTATFASTGPDGQRGTPDDVICLVVGGKNWDDFYNKIMWDYVKQWTLPEGLQPAIDKAVKKPETERPSSLKWFSSPFVRLPRLLPFR